MKNEKLTVQEKSIFCHEIAMILSSGMSIQVGLEIVYPELSYHSLQEVTKQLLLDYQTYGTFYEAVKKSKCFDTYMEEMIQIGEESGNLDDVMHHLSQYYERSDDMLSQLKDAFTYPMILMGMMIIVIGLFVIKILPIFQNVLLSLGTSLSPFAMHLMSFSKYFAMVSFVVLFMIAILVLGFYGYSKSHPESSMQESVLSRFFATKKLYTHITMANITYALSLFLSSGYPMEEAVRYLPEFVKHPVIKKKITAIVDDVQNGMAFEDAIKERNLYEGVYANLLQIGFKSGRQDEVMKKLVALYEKDVSSSISSFLNIIEPSLVALLSFVVGIILLSVMLPLMSIMSSL